MDVDELQNKNESLAKELAELKSQRAREMQEYESKVQQESSKAQQHSETISQKQDELDAIKTQMVRVTRQLDDEVTKRDYAQQESQQLSRKLQEMGGPGVPDRRGDSKKGGHEEQPGGGQTSMKLMRVVDQWMRHKDLQQALLRGASINDMAFSTLVQVLADCPSLNMLDLSQNQITMDSCADICQLITSAPSLSFISLEGNLFSLRSVGYFMTAVMERQNTKKLTPLDLLDLQGNEGLVNAMHAPAPEHLSHKLTKS